MSHGSKKWIKTFDGKLKRSNDRTKKDYYRGLRNWEPYDGKPQRKPWRRHKSAEFCPQCKHNYKPIQEARDAHEAAVALLKAEWKEKYAHVIKAYEKSLQQYYYMKERGYDAFVPRHPERDYEAPQGWLAYRRENSYRLPELPFIRWFDETYLCHKHKYWARKKQEMWDGAYPGKNCYYTWMRKEQYRSYRSEMKSLMQKAKYDDEYYEDIAPYTHGWLD
jgi:hypothetical protein